MARIYAIIGLALTLVLGGLGGTVYVQHLQSVITAKGQALTDLSEAKAVLEKKITTDAAVQAADNARAAQAEASLKAFKEKTDAEIKGLKHPDRLCFDGDDTRSLQRIFRQR